MVGSGAAIADAVRSGRTTAVEVARDHLDLITSSDLNAFTSVLEDHVLDRAAHLDEMVREGGDPGPLTGVPIALKDLFDQAGQVTTCGSAFHRERPAISATVVDRLEAAGAMIVGRTNLHEFAYGFSSENHWFGAVRNPWDPTTSPGGSSGGSAAAVAAGLAPIGIGTDTGGSVRVPAALTGTFGLKVTHGRTPLTGVFPLAVSVDTVGPLARSTDDLRAAFSVMRGHDPLDPWSSPDRPEPAERWPLRIGVPREWIADAPLDPEVRSAFGRALDDLADLGAEVVEISTPTLRPWGELNALMGAQAARVHRAWLADPTKEYGPEVAERLVLALAITSDELVDALAWQAALKAATEQAFGRVDLLATPAVGANRKVIGEPSITIEGVDYPYRIALAWFASLVNHMHTPALVAPLTTGRGLPHSLQLIAPWGQEVLLLGTSARAEEAGIFGFRPPSGS